VHRATGAITLDGKADEPAWKAAQLTPAFQLTEGSGPVSGPTHARLLWDDANLYIFVDIVDTDVYSPFTEHDAPVWRADAVEVFIDADKNGQGYVELDANPRGAVFDAWIPTTKQHGGKEGWTSQVAAAATVDGTLDMRDDVDKGWHLELRIPLATVKGGDPKMAVRLPPKPGDTWKLNIVRVDKPKKGKVAASSWAAITIKDFHATDRLLTVRFAE
jgi:hypothetical protein